MIAELTQAVEQEAQKCPARAIGTYLLYVTR